MELAEQPRKMSSMYRIILLSAAFLCLGLSCADTETYSVASASPEQVASVVGDWADASGFTRIQCEKYLLNNALENSCYEIGEADRVPQYLVAAKAEQGSPVVIVWISFGGVTKSDRSVMLKSLGDVLVAEFQAGNVVLKN